jgi:signal transduction histidine kinase
VITGEQSSSPPTQEELAALVAGDRIQRRPRPYIGDSVNVPLSRLDPADAGVVRALYEFLGGLYGLVGPRLGGGKAALQAVQGFLRATGFAELAQRIDRLGAALLSDDTPIDLRKVYHDVRGGGLPALLMHLDMVAEGEAQPEDLERIFVLSRDQLKIIRNAIPDLDPDGYAHDLEAREHSTDLLLAKWSTATYRLRDAEVALRLRCEFEGSISERCMEFAALDRVIYNLVNNAARFAADGQVELNIFPIHPPSGPNGDETDLRFVVMNRITPEHRERVHDDLGDELSRVFEGGYTTGGYGLGLRICGDFVTHGYGLPSLRVALDDGYLGARLVRDTFVAWFHWPARRSAA